MARISLRAYNRDIEVMIDKNQIDEAFAHCRHILQHYPKHITTYRLMGKALLEAQRFGDAADIFHRVLSSVPDDFIAHLGMSIIREDEGNLDAAIWHMERSFEVQPSNAAVQVELRRLYGLRDGVTPQKIQLTRGALARMSAKSNLYSQAITELRAALSKDPQRPDLQVVLAEMYMQTGARMEAIETCNSLINKFPFCLTANRILAEVLPETERADQAQEFRTRLGELDPYYLQLSPVAPTLEQVPDGAVTIERLEFDGETYHPVEKSQPTWAASLGVDLAESEESPGEPAPDWLQEDETETGEEDKPTEGLPMASEEQEMQDSEQIPDWMEEIEEADSDPTMEEDQPTEPQLSEQDAAGEAQPFIDQAGSEQESEPVPDWMKEIGEAESSEEILQEIQSADEESLTEAQPTTDEGESELHEEESDFLGMAVAAGAAAVGAVLSQQEDDQVESEPSEEPESQEDMPADAPAAEPLPDWMTSPEDESESSPTAEGDTTLAEPEPELPQEDDDSTETFSAEEEDQQLPDWMSEAESGPAGDTPDWLREAMEGEEEPEGDLPGVAAVIAGAVLASESEDLGEDDEEVAEPTPEVEADQLDDAVPEEVAEEGLGAGEAALVGAAAAAAVLASGDDQDQQDTEEPDQEPLGDEVESPSADDQEIPDWLQDLGEDLPAGEPQDASLVFEDQPAEEETPAEPEFGESIEDTPVAVPLAEADQDEFPEGEFPESIPDWLSEVSPEEIPEVVAATEDELDIVRAEIPVWLKKMEAQHKAELAATGEIERPEDLELDEDFTDLAGEGVPSWLVTAMEPELPAEAEELEDISQVFEAPEEVSIDQMDLETTLADEEEPEEELAEVEETTEAIELEQQQDELVPDDLSPEAVAEVDQKPALDVTEVEEDALLAGQPDVGAEELEMEDELLLEETAQAESDEEPEGVSVPGLAAAAAAGVAASLIFDEDDTQPTAVREEPEDEQETEQPVPEREAEVADVYEEELETEEEAAPEAELEEEAVAAIDADQPLSAEDEDAAMAWLESLAAKQGAAEEELLTPADERLEQPPDWIKEDQQEAEAEEGEFEALDTALAAGTVAGVAAGMLADDETSPDEQKDAETPEEPSEWIPEIPLSEEVEPAAEEALEQVEIEPEPIEIEEEPVIVEELAAAAEVDLDQVEEVPTSEEIPDWLSGLAEEQEAGIEPGTMEWTADMLAEEPEESAIPVEAPPEEKLDLNVASLAQLEKIPGIGFIHAQNILDYRAAHGPFRDFEQLQEVDGFSADMLPDLEEYLSVEVVKEVTGVASDVPELQNAWNNVSQGNIQEAVDQYTALINQDQHLDEIIRDLHSALGKYPSDSSLYQTLGDAYMRSNMLQEALDAYNRAEDLLI